MLYENRLTEQTVRKEKSGEFAKKYRATVAAFIVLPLIATIATFLTKRSISSIMFYGIPLFILSAFIALIVCPLVFRIEYDYSLLGPEFSVSVIRNSRIRRTKCRVDLRLAKVYPIDSCPKNGYRKVLNYLPTDSFEFAYAVEVCDEDDSSIKDLFIIAPDKKMLKAMNDVNRSMRIRRN